MNMFKAHDHIYKVTDVTMVCGCIDFETYSYTNHDNHHCVFWKVKNVQAWHVIIYTKH